MEISEIKDHLDIIEVAEDLGIRVDKRTQKALCPFHNDKKPSLQFSQKKQICTCFSSNCSAGTMDIFDLVQKKRGINSYQSILYLSDLAEEKVFGIAVENDWEVQDRSVTEEASQDSVKILSEVFEYFESSFLSSKPAKDYAISRKLDLKTLTIGYNAGTFHHGTNKHLIEGALKLGLLFPGGNSGGKSVFGVGSIVFALRDERGRITGMYFRAVEPRPKKFEGKSYPRHLYLKNRRGLYPHYPPKETQRLLLAESIIDAATLMSIPEIAQHYEILALYGASSLSKEHLKAIKSLEDLREVLLFYDGDDAGKSAVETHMDRLRKELPQTVNISFVNTPLGTDVNELAQTHDTSVFEQLISDSSLFSISKENSLVNASKITAHQASEIECTEKHEEVTPGKVSPISHLLDTDNPNRIRYQSNTASYQVKGGVRRDLDSMKITLEISNIESSQDESLYQQKLRDKVELYEYKQIERYARAAADKLGLRADVIESDLNYLTDLLDAYRDEIQEKQKQAIAAPLIISQSERERLEAFGRRKTLIPDINKMIGLSGIVGEEKSRLVLFVIASAYKCSETLHALIQGSTGSGKSHVMESVVSLMPSEDIYWFTRVTESSLYNYGTDELRGKILAFEDWDGLEEKAEYAIRELISKGKITSSTSGKDEQTGSIKAFHHTVNGPVTTFACTTHGHIYEDNMNRVFVIAVDESSEQTQRVITYQNAKDAGKINAKQEQRAKEQLQNFIRTLRPYKVINPYAGEINLPSDADNLRRLNRLFKAFVKQVTVLHQHQRNKDAQGRLVTDKQDVKIAIEILFDSIVLKVDELDGSLRMFYEQLKAYVSSKSQAYEFGRREVRQTLGISKTQQHTYMTQLLELEYIQQIGGYSNRGFTYKVVYWDDNAAMRNRIKQYLDDQLEKL